jgi:uncharacterized protein (TIGR02466 family)
MTIQHLFTTPIKVVSIPNFYEINLLFGKAMKIGFKNCVTNNLNEQETNLIINTFVKEAEDYFKEATGRNPNLKLQTSWSSITNKYEFVSPHAHPIHTVVGVYYVKTSENCGDLLLHDARGTTDFDVYYEKDKNGNTLSYRSTYRHTPKIGQLILFPASLIHSVEPNMSEETRISIGLNFKNYKYEK